MEVVKAVDVVEVYVLGIELGSEDGVFIGVVAVPQKSPATILISSHLAVAVVPATHRKVVIRHIVAFDAYICYAVHICHSSCKAEDRLFVALILVKALDSLVESVGGNSVGKMAILAEGDAQGTADIIYLEKLPLFFH